VKSPIAGQLFNWELTTQSLLDLRGTQFKTDPILLSVRRGCVDAQLAVRAIRLEPTAVGL